MTEENQPITPKKHRVNLTVTPELYERLVRLSPHAPRVTTDVILMLYEYCDLREKYGNNIYEGIHHYLRENK